GAWASPFGRGTGCLKRPVRSRGRPLQTSGSARVTSSSRPWGPAGPTISVCAVSDIWFRVRMQPVPTLPIRTQSVRTQTELAESVQLHAHRPRAAVQRERDERAAESGAAPGRAERVVMPVLQIRDVVGRVAQDE